MQQLLTILLLALCLTQGTVILRAADITATFDSSDGSSGFSIRDSSNAEVARINSDGGLTASDHGTFDGGAQVLTIKPGTIDHAYFGIFADTDNPGTRSGWIGFGSAGSNVFTIKNEMGENIFFPDRVSIGTGAGDGTFEVDSKSHPWNTKLESNWGQLRFVLDNVTDANYIESANNDFSASRNLVLTGFMNNTLDGLLLKADSVEVTGKLGIGTDECSFKLEVKNDNYNAIRAIGDSANSIGIYVNNTISGGGEWGLIVPGADGATGKKGGFTIWDQDAMTARMVINDQGKVAFGCDPLYFMTINGGGGCLALKSASSDHCYMAWYADSDNPNTRSAYFGYPSSGSTVLTVNNELGNTFTFLDNVGIGLTPTYQLQLSTNSAAKPGSSSWTIASDRRLKKNFGSIDGALAKMLSLKGVTFQWKDPASQGGLDGTYMGMIAQEVEQVFPNWVGETPDGYKNLTPIGFEALTVESIRQLNSNLKKEVSELKNELSILRKELDIIRRQ